ncbi:MAG: hypothetical protein JKY01_03670 [Pseudomonadales bacterium]|nr:hypothetical protein [Pseudomonadales bacterium]
MKRIKDKSSTQHLAAIISLILAASSNISAAEPNDEEALGYAIKGDKESPNVLYFVPWKSPSPPSKIDIPPPEINSLDVLDRDTLLREQIYFKQLQKQEK